MIAPMPLRDKPVFPPSSPNLICQSSNLHVLYCQQDNQHFPPPLQPSYRKLRALQLPAIVRQSPRPRQQAHSLAAQPQTQSAQCPPMPHRKPPPLRTQTLQFLIIQMAPAPRPESSSEVRHIISGQSLTNSYCRWNNRFPHPRFDHHLRGPLHPRSKVRRKTSPRSGTPPRIKVV